MAVTMKSVMMAAEEVAIVMVAVKTTAIAMVAAAVAMTTARWQQR